MAGPGDEIAAGAGGHGRLRASRADREQVIGTLKAAFVQGMLDRDEFGQRVGEAFAARTHADLAALTADLPAGLAEAPLTQPARAEDEQLGPRPGKVIAVATALYAGLWAFTFLVPWPADSEGDPPVAVSFLFFSATFIYLLILVIAVGAAVEEWREKHCSGHLTRRSAPSTGGQPARRLPTAGPAGQLPPAGHGDRHTAEAARSRRPRQRRACAEAVPRAS